MSFRRYSYSITCVKTIKRNTPKTLAPNVVCPDMSMVCAEGRRGGERHGVLLLPDARLRFARKSWNVISLPVRDRDTFLLSTEMYVLDQEALSVLSRPLPKKHCCRGVKNGGVVVSVGGRECFREPERKR